MPWSFQLQPPITCTPSNAAAVRQFLANVQADRYKDLKHGDLFAALGLDFPKMEIKAPTFYSGSDDVANSNVAAIQLGATGFSFSPCAVAASPAAISISATVSALTLPCLARHS